MKKHRILFRTLMAASLVTLLSVAVCSPGFAAKPNGQDQSSQELSKRAYIPDQTSPEGLELVAVGTVKEVLKSDLIRMTDEKVYNLLNIRVPLLYMPKEQEYLTKMLVGKKVGLYQRRFPGVLERDSRGNLAGQMLTQDNIWVQSDLVLNGLAWVDGNPRNRDMVQKLYQYETLARNKRAGFWAAPELSVKDEKSILEKSYNTFQVVEGTIKSTKQVGDQLFYLGFGDDATTDFTLVISKDFAQYFYDPEIGRFNPLKWKGRRLRVRGWVINQSGPMMELTYPEQIEFTGNDSQPLPIAMPKTDPDKKARK
ncbi:MAG: thermonuclease family protein [Micavibrio sp.]|nr:thermonuclease family protein [Micavibrio sp.]